MNTVLLTASIGAYCSNQAAFEQGLLSSEPLQDIDF
ncbi:hypothetical protein MNBD_GAMMA05-876 [hydrothermal vent metagenome]|uniref:Uncharacterized protein n=1 Tax=hydrothermal vent metagenome TaxID=652676 RepID=A0A3B0W9E8_9ZZZZ